jgi:hypothetical protein
MRRHARPRAVAAVVSACALALAACSDSGDDAASGTPAPPTATPSPASVAGATAADGSGAPSPDTTPSTAPATDPTTTIVETRPTVPEEGVPGIDSDDAVCRAWSRFGGSFQVVAVAATFGSGDPVALEVVAAPTVTAAYEELLANWPAELDGERDVVADDYLGPFARRAERARQALRDAGADDALVATVEQAWLAALAARDPSVPDVVVDLPDEVWTVVDAAAADLGAQLVPIPDDPSLVTDAEVPLTQRFLEDNCPDQGTLSGDPGS